MARLAGHGIEVYLPGGWEGRISRRAPVAGATAYPVSQFATFPLPAGIADFGGGVPAVMRPTDIFAVLFEYGPESVGRALFARVGMPRRLSPSSFHPYTLRRGVGGQSGTQWFFTEERRPFTLYVVLGSHALRNTLVPKVNLLLGQITVLPPGSVAVAGGTSGSAGAA
jgi:hypothetical protein